MSNIVYEQHCSQLESRIAKYIIIIMLFFKQFAKAQSYEGE